MLPKAFVLVATALLPLASAASSCKCVGLRLHFLDNTRPLTYEWTPGDSCWPTEPDWQKLNTTINGQLIKAKPPASVCYRSEPNYNEAICSTIRLQWSNSSFHAQDSISIDYPAMADDPCPPIFPNGTSVGGNPNSGRRGCSLGRYPNFVVNATSADMISTALRWASENRVRVVIKNTGHSHLGR